MEDPFANILQRNYGLKTVGKSASYGPRSDERAAARALERGKSVGSGLGRSNQSAAAALLLAGDNLGSLSKSARQPDPSPAYGSAGDAGFRGTSRGASVGGSDGMFGGTRSGSGSGSSLAELAEGSAGRSTGASSDGPVNEEVPGVGSQSRSAAKVTPSRSANGREATEAGVRGRSFGSAESRRSTEEEVPEARRKDGKGGQAGSIPSSCDSPRSQTPKSVSTVSDSGESPLKGSFMRGFGRSRAARSAAQVSTGSGDSQGELSGGETANGWAGTRPRSESTPKTASGRSSLSTDGSEVESMGRAAAGFTVPASNGTAFPDQNEGSGRRGPESAATRSSEAKVWSPESESESERRAAVRRSSERIPTSPKTPSAATGEWKESGGPGPGPLGRDSRREPAGGDESGGARRAAEPMAMDGPGASPSHIVRARRSSRGEGASRANGRASTVEEPLTKFEVNLGAGGAAQRGRRKSDSLADVWLTVEQIRLVTQPSSWPAPSRAAPAPPPARRHSGGDGQGVGAKSQAPERSGDDRWRGAGGTESERQRSSPKSEGCGPAEVDGGPKVQERGDAEAWAGGARRAASGSERANGGAQKAGEGPRTGYVLPEVTVVDLGAEEPRPSREERRRLREQMERDRRRAKREEERAREKERVAREGPTESMSEDAPAGGVREGLAGGRRERVSEPMGMGMGMGSDAEAVLGGRQPSRPREGRREKVFDPRERHFVETATRRDEKDIQYRALRQQEKEFRARLARQEEAREAGSERAGERLRRSAEKAALEAQERAERAAVERAVQDAHERAERAARHRAAAAREKERAKERERERERERDREEEKLRDRVREKERGLAEQLRSRDGFRATSEPRQRPAVSAGSPSTLSRFSSGGSLGKMSAAVEARRSPAAQKAVDEWTNMYSPVQAQAPVGAGAGQAVPERFQEIPGEPADRRKLRLEKQLLIEERAAAALREKNMRDLAVQREQEERQRFAGSLDADVRRWSVGKEGNLRALLSTLHVMLWAECNWKVVSMSDLVSAPSVKKAYQRAILCVHPDKVQQKGANVKQKYIAEKVFDLLKDAYSKFNSELSY